jgi:hypothetical protein
MFGEGGQGTFAVWVKDALSGQAIAQLPVAQGTETFAALEDLPHHELVLTPLRKDANPPQDNHLFPWGGRDHQLIPITIPDHTAYGSGFVWVLERKEQATAMVMGT